MIILTVLKVILKIILIILLLLAAVLLLRLKYSVSAEYDEGFGAEARLSLLFGALKAVYRYGGEDEGLELLIFGRSKKKKTEEKPPAQADGEYDFYESDGPDIPTEEDHIQEEPETQETAPSETQDIPSEETQEAAAETVSYDESEKKRRKKEKTPKKEGFLQKIQNAYNNFDELRERYDILLLLKNLKIYVVQQLKSLGIKGGSLDGIIGLGDPSQTGMVLGGIGVIRAFAPLDIDISGEFEKQYIALNGSLYGKTYLLKLLLPILKLIFKKPVRTILYDILFKKGTEK